YSIKQRINIFVYINNRGSYCPTPLRHGEAKQINYAIYDDVTRVLMQCISRIPPVVSPESKNPAERQGSNG
ncbi:hypothetical protein, partial [Klebsiella pneumoniae]|uniref:hypothetical protein n=1 Tax=Klebsiella pneumoniae TaxID=573 RepID=UPI0019679723